jgi:hypothetical protein
MKLASDTTAGLWVPISPSLDGVLSRLEALSLQPRFAMQRELALARALQPYLGPGSARLLAPLAQEVELANLYLYADFYPEDGQLTLIEQLRDVITEHIPEEERVWLDPLKHSYMDLGEVVRTADGDNVMVLRSVGDGRLYRVTGGEATKELRVGQVLLTRLIRKPGDPESEEAVIAGNAIVLSAEDGKVLYDTVREWERTMELSAGSFALAEWQEFAKRYGHILLWNFAQMRMAALVEAVVSIQYVFPNGQPYLYALAIYEHHEFKFLASGFGDLEGWHADAAGGPADDSVSAKARTVRSWIRKDMRQGKADDIVARATLTTTQLLIECDSPDRLNSIKHQLAAAFGFSLHFHGESLTPPPRQIEEARLTQDGPVTLTITPEEDRTLLATFLETTYLEWADQDCPAFKGKTPRHAAAADGRTAVAAIIDEMERNDLGVRRTGRAAFDYNVLRAHVGLC